MNKIITILLLIFTLPAISGDGDLPNPNAEGIKKVHGVISEIEYVDTRPIIREVEAVESIKRKLGIGYVGIPIYHVKINDAITLEVGSQESFKRGDCVLVWYDEGMGDSPNLSLLGQAGIAKTTGCSK